MRLPDYSVLMSVYTKEKGAFFERALASIWAQTHSTNDFVLVCDGPLTEELDEIIQRHQAAHPELHVFRLEENHGLGYALNHGLSQCSNEYVMRADSDDICVPERAAKQLEYMMSGGYDLISTDLILFADDPSNPTSMRRVPSDRKAIIKFAKTRSPFNHPAVMFRKEAIQDVGGYQPLKFKEDYYLWIRVLLSGRTVANMNEPLVFMREGQQTVRRRASKEAHQSQKELLRFMRKAKFISLPRYLFLRLLYWLEYIMPTGLVRFAYRVLFRSKVTRS